MKINITRINDAVNLYAVNESGHKILFDGSEEIGGQNLGMRPMQVLLSSLGACASMDVLSILKKMQQNVVAYNVEVEGNRVKTGDVSLFENIHIKFSFNGDLDETKIKRAIELSVTKYCSVAKTLEPTAKITYSFEILN